MTQSKRFDISTAFAAALVAAPDLAGANVQHNPRDPFGLQDGLRIVFVEDQSDGFVDDKGEQGLRRFVFALGVMCRSEDGPEAIADADQIAAEAALRDAAHQIARTDGTTPKLRELQTVFKVEGVDVGGALILTTFEFTYRRPRPERTA